MISKEEVLYIGRLAHLTLSENEIAIFTEQLSDILEYVEKINSVNTADVQPMIHVIPIQNVFVDDEIEQSLSVDVVLKMAPIREGEFFKVPVTVQK